jgi:hypothetical protein
MSQTQRGVNTEWVPQEIVRSKDISDSPKIIGVCGMLLGISRKRPVGTDNKQLNQPYYFHMTDFSKMTHSTRKFFNDGDFKRDELTGKVYDVCVYPEKFRLISNKLKIRSNNEFDLEKFVRYFQIVDKQLFYEDKNEYNWFLEKFNIWLIFKVQTKYYFYILDLICTTGFNVIFKNKLKIRLTKFGIWNDFVKVYGGENGMHKEIIYDLNNKYASSDIDSDFSFDSRIESSAKKRKIDNISFNTVNILEEKNHDNSYNNILGNRKRNKKFDIHYSLISELKEYDNYLPQFIIINRIEVYQKYDSYVYSDNNRNWRIKSVKLKVFDENGESLIIYIKDYNLLNFVGLDRTSYDYIEDLNIGIQTKLSERELGFKEQFMGMIIKRSTTYPGVWKWTYEYSTEAINEYKNNDSDNS